MSHPGHCFVCDESLTNGRSTRVVKKRGITTFINKSKEKKDNKWQFLEKLTEVEVHDRCQAAYYENKEVKKVPIVDPEPQVEFKFSDYCFICGKQCGPTIKKEYRNVTKEQFQTNIENIIAQRGDQWGQEVQARINSKCLIQVGARYHKVCQAKFRFISENHELGRPKIPDLEAAFLKVCRYMEESDDSQFTLRELMDRMEGFEVTKETFKQKLRNKYNTDIIMIEKRGKQTIICFRNTGYKILMESWYEKKASTEEDERLRVVSAAADIIREDIRSKVYDTSAYPAPGELLNDVEDDIPESLQVFLNKVLIKGKKKKEEKLTTKRNSIAHAIISIVRPRSFISSIQLATGIVMNKKFGSRFIIDSLNSLGFCTSYHNLNNYEASAVMHCETTFDENAFVQYVFDNADHNACTLDGFNTFHYMGGICCVTPKSGINPKGEIPKLNKAPKAELLASKMKVPIVPCPPTDETRLGLKSIIFFDVSQLELEQRDLLPPAYSLHILAKSQKIANIPSWRGYMETISQDRDYKVSGIYCLPFVRLPPSDKTTINTVLHLAARECLRIDQKTGFVTLDQPLYIKARELAANDRALLIDLVIRLGGFHLLMSFLAAIGTIMDGSGLKELLALVYAILTVDHILTGHAFSRAIRAHLIIYTALGSLIAEHANIDDQEYSHVNDLLKDFTVEPPSLSEINEDGILIKIQAKMKQVMEDLTNASRTSKLWMQYFHCITIVMQFIESERLGNWQLHLQCVRDMLPIFHAAGHLNYAKSAQIYLQDMSELSTKMAPDEFERFTTQGFFTIRRTDKKWAGIWSDMTVEQTLMRTMKVSGGLTNGRGVNKEGAVAKWILTMPIAYEVIDAFETFCGVRSATSEQHTDFKPNRMNKDNEDYLKFREWLTVHNPFKTTETHKLMSIADGLCAGDGVNCDQAFEMGLASMKTMIGVNAGEVKLKRSARVKSIATTKRGIVINNQVMAVDTTLLFQRIAAVINQDSQLAQKALNHELAPFPASLFDDNGGMRKSDKSKLYKELRDPKFKITETLKLTDCKVIIDGGFLLHKVVWQVGDTYEQILASYENYIKKNYGSTNVIVVFDGYKEADVGVKSYERFKRSRTNMGSEVVFEKDMRATLKPDDFLANAKNKDRLIDFLTPQLTNAKIGVKQGSEDADRLIVVTAIEQLNGGKKVVVVGQDVDLMVLLIALTPVDQTIYLMKPGVGSQATEFFSTDHYRHLKEGILVIHAFTGCDTTSSVYNKGKKLLYNKFSKKKTSTLADDVAVFNNSIATKESIKQAGERLMLLLYGAGKSQKSLNKFRYERFVASTARSKTALKLQQLPPTSASTEEHTWRVYFQVQKWLGNDKLNAVDWGWKLQDQVFLPVMTKEPPAPEEILNMIHCSCKGSCSNRCGCRKAGLKCSIICSGCHGNSCSNCKEIDISPEPLEDDDEFDDLLQHSMEFLYRKPLEDEEDDIEEGYQWTQSPEEEESMIIDEDDDDDSDNQPTTSKRARLD